MKEFNCEDFLLENQTARILFNDYAKDMPIFDYHCHVNVNEIAKDKSYDNLTQLWLGGDHYKWRAMRLFGIDESYITGDKPDFEKFEKYAEMIGYAIGNPLYHWTHLELKRYFNITKPLSLSTAKEIYDEANAILQNGLTTRKFIEKSGVVAICSTDDPTDSLFDHISLKNEGYSCNVMPTFRPDKAVEIGMEQFLDYVEKLGEVSSVKINSYEKLLNALERRLDFFVSVGCKISDHSLSVIPFAKTNLQEVSAIFEKRLQKEELSSLEIEKYKFYTLFELAKNYHKRGLIMQLHIGALRNNNEKMFNLLGADSGFDSIDDKEIAQKLSAFLSACNNFGLPKTILYNLNAKDNYTLATMMGNFAGGSFGSLVQFGSGWWFNDQKTGMIEQLTAFANEGLLCKFVGMLTDSRSFSSYTRHEYFRRILCNLLGKWVENGEFVCDMAVLGEIVKNISFNNISSYFSQE